MEFDTHLARIQGCLTLAKRLVGPLDHLCVATDRDAVQIVMEKIQDGIAGFSDNELSEANLFLLLNSNLVVSDEALQESELGHLIGISPTISLELLVSLSVEVFSPRIFLYDAMTFLPVALSYQLIMSFTSIYVHNDNWKVAGNLDTLCLAIYSNVITSKCEESFVCLLETVLISMCNQESKANFCDYTNFLKAVLLPLKFSLREEVPPSSHKWKHIFARPTASDTKALDYEDRVKKIIIEHASKLCSSASIRLQSETNEESLSLFESVRELAFECVTALQKFSPTHDKLLKDLMSFAKNPQDMLDNIKNSSLPSLCSNSLIESANQQLWLKALIHHKEGQEDEEAIMTLHKLVHLLEEDDNIHLCHVFHQHPQPKVLLRDLALRCFTRLSLEAKSKILKSRVMNCESHSNLITENCELNILEVLNRLVATEGTDCQVEDLMVLAYESPQLVTKHVLVTATMNKLFSTSVAPKVIQSLAAVFASPADIAFQATTLTDVTLSECIFNSNEINKDCQGLENLVRVLFQEKLMNTEYFLRYCVFPALFRSVNERQERTVILILEILMVVQLKVSNWEAKVNVPALLVFLGKLVESFSRDALFAESQGSIIVREVFLRNIDKIFSNPHCIESFQDADKDWMLDELSVLSPANRHYFAAIAPQWKLFDGDQGNEPCVTLATILPYLHVTEWHQIGKILPSSCGGNLGENSSEALTFCWAVNLIVRTGTSLSSSKVHLNLISCVRNLGSVIQSYLQNGVDPKHLAPILRELVLVLEYFPRSDQFDVAVFLLPIMFDIVDRGSQDGGTLTAFAKVILGTSVQCVRRDLGRQLKRVLTSFVNDRYFTK